MSSTFLVCCILFIFVASGVIGEDPRCKVARNVQKKGITCFFNLTHVSGSSGQGLKISDSTDPKNCYPSDHCKFFLDNFKPDFLPQRHRDPVKNCSDVFCCSSSGICDKNGGNIARIGFISLLILFFLSCALTMY